MDNRYTDIKYFIDIQSNSFKHFLKEFLLDSDSWDILNRIALQTDVYIFSGAIRNFFIGYFEVRDLDIVVKNIDQIRLPKHYVEKISIKQNSFGGYKINLGHLNIDVWGLEKTWGILNERKNANVYELVRTAFFNFSAIAFDYKNSKFIYTEDFCNFINTRIMDIVYNKNPNIPLCIINTMYYSQKYDFTIGFRLCEWIVANYIPDFNFIDTQRKHFNKIMYTDQEINRFVYFCFNVLKQR